MSSRPSPTSIERARTPSPPIFHLHRRPTTPGRRVTTPDLSISIPSQLPNNNQLLSPNISNYPSVPLTPRRSISSDRKGSWPPPGGETKKRMKDEAWTVLKGVREALVGAVCALGLVNMVLNLMFLIQGKVFCMSWCSRPWRVEQRELITAWLENRLLLSRSECRATGGIDSHTSYPITFVRSPPSIPPSHADGDPPTGTTTSAPPPPPTYSQPSSPNSSSSPPSSFSSWAAPPQ